MTWSARLPQDRRLRDWLFSTGSLTRHIRERCREFRVVRLRQSPLRPYPDELPVLDLGFARRALVRDVILYGDAQPLIFGHSIVALDDLNGPWRPVRSLGNRPLADALYADPLIVRAPLAFCKLGTSHPLYRRVSADLGALSGDVWARRSLFRSRSAPLLVTEVFLPAILRLPWASRLISSGA
jgi:chorismate--pyruvate lyase